MSIFLPDPVVKRLPMYYRYLSTMEQQNKSYVSSAELSLATGLTASQVRQDVYSFGGEGRQGIGYPVSELKKHIEKLLGIHQTRTMIIIGSGNLGHALMHYSEFSEKKFEIAGVFDVNPQKIGSPIGTLTIQDLENLESFVGSHPVDIAILTLPAVHAQAVAQRLYHCGVHGFWNFAPVDLQLPKNAAIVNVHLDESLELLSYHLMHPEI